MSQNESAKVADAGEGALNSPGPLAAAQHASILSWSPATVRAVRPDQQNAPPPQPRSRCVTVIDLVGNHSPRLLPGTPGTMSPPTRMAASVVSLSRTSERD